MPYTGPEPARRPLSSDDITDGIISTADLADSAVTIAKIGDATLTALSSVMSSTTTAAAQRAALGLGVKVGYFTRDLSTATGAQAITGVGFTPTAIIVFCHTPSNTNQFSVGFASAINSGHATYDDGDNSAGTYGTTAAGFFLMDQGSGSYSYADINSWDADGFTVGHVKTGAPTGTATFNYLALAL
jgi:hypothetical protein